MKVGIRALWPITLLLLLTACSGSGVKGNGNISTISKQLSTFKHVNISGSFNVLITAGRTQKVTVTADSNILNYIITTVKDNALYVSEKSGFALSPSTTPAINIRLQKLDSVKTAGSVKVRVGNIVNNDLSVETSGHGNIQLVGKVKDLEIATTGSSIINSVGLKAESVKVNILGTGDVSVYAANELDVKITGSGDVNYAGDPTITQDVTGVGKIIKIKRGGRS